MTDPENPIIAWQDGKALKIKELSKSEITDVGQGSFIKAIRTKDKKIFCAWENDGKINTKKL